MIKFKTLPSLEYLHQILYYDLPTGYLYWKTRPLKEFDCKALWHQWNIENYMKQIGADTETWKPYLTVTLKGQTYVQHRIIFKMVTGAEPSLNRVIDHINGNGKDNRLCNLREATLSLNAKNRKGCIPGQGLCLEKAITILRKHNNYHKPIESIYRSRYISQRKTFSNVS